MAIDALFVRNGGWLCESFSRNSLEKNSFDINFNDRVFMFVSFSGKLEKRPPGFLSLP